MNNLNYDTLICFTDGNELHIAIGCLLIKPHKELILLSENMEKNDLDSIKRLLKEKHIKCLARLVKTKEFAQNESLGRIAVLVNECTSFDEFCFLINESRNGIDFFYADVTEGQVYPVGNYDSKPIHGGPLELEVDEILEASGYNIQTSAEEIMKSPIISELLGFITQNTGRWDIVRRMIKNNYIPNGDWIQFGTSHGLDYKNGSALYDFIGFLTEKEFLKDKIVTKNRLHIKVPDPIVRTFIQTTGLWLEAITFKVLYGLPFIDDIMMDVRFLWGSPPCVVNNEIDVMAASDSRLILISCKDVESLSTSMLNELEVYSKRMGGNKTLKILVTAKKPSGQHIFERAEAMGINIVWFSHNIEKFTQILRLIMERDLDINGR